MRAMGFSDNSCILFKYVNRNHYYLLLGRLCTILHRLCKIYLLCRLRTIVTFHIKYGILTNKFSSSKIKLVVVNMLFIFVVSSMRIPIVF